MNKTLLGITDAARMLDVSPERVRQLEREGKLLAERMSRGQRIFKAEDVERLVAEREHQKQSKAGGKQ